MVLFPIYISILFPLSWVHHSRHLLALDTAKRADDAAAMEVVVMMMMAATAMMAA